MRFTAEITLAGACAPDAVGGRVIADLGLTQHVIDGQLGGRRDGLGELRRFGTEIVDKLA